MGVLLISQHRGGQHTAAGGAKAGQVAKGTSVAERARHSDRGESVAAKTGRAEQGRARSGRTAGTRQRDWCTQRERCGTAQHGTAGVGSEQVADVVAQRPEEDEGQQLGLGQDAARHQGAPAAGGAAGGCGAQGRQWIGQRKLGSRARQRGRGFAHTTGTAPRCSLPARARCTFWGSCLACSQQGAGPCTAALQVAGQGARTAERGLTRRGRSAAT